MQLRQSYFSAITILVAVILSSCNKKPVSDKPLRSSDAGLLYEEKLIDVPLPVGARPVVGYVDSGQGAYFSCVRHTPLDEHALYDFYLSMLEQMGWRLTGQVRSPREHLMVWEKAYKFCVISIRLVYPVGSKKRPTKPLLVIHTGAKRVPHELHCVDILQ